jgi:subtilase family serine protease
MLVGNALIFNEFRSTSAPHMKNNPWFPLLLSAALLQVLVPDLRAQTFTEATPAIQWKYGWQDGKRANTTGSARNKNILPNASGVPSTGYLPSQIAHAYGFDQITGTNATGSGQKIAIIVAYGSPSLQRDLNTFNSQYGLPTNTVSVYYPNGTPGTNNSGWAAETTLDVEWSHAMAPGASIAAVVAPNASGTSLLNAINYATGTLKANVVSMSWGMAEFAGLSSYDAYFNKLGISFVASSGDSGAGVSWPAVSTNVVGVGGTSLLYNTGTGTITSETAWSGSGGGESKYEAIPSYQLGWNTTSVTDAVTTNSTKNLTSRGVPDVSYVADPYTGVSVYFTDPASNIGGWYIFGGTSAGAPQWAALLARRSALGNAGASLFNAVTYAAAKNSYSTLFRDVSTGSNGYMAKGGYDLVTGLGSPVANGIAALSSTNSTGSPLPTPTPSPTPRQKTTLTAAQLPSAVILIDKLNTSFAMDRLARNPGGLAFLTDGHSMLDLTQAQASMNKGNDVTVDFYMRVSREEYLPANPITWMFLKKLNYSQTSLYVNDGFGLFPVYELDLNSMTNTPLQTTTNSTRDCR